MSTTLVVRILPNDRGNLAGKLADAELPTQPGWRHAGGALVVHSETIRVHTEGSVHAR